ncbi:peptidoglycan editing factor PgeF [Paucibacter sp. AS339]|uniref:peptidoglycan editing factor PgeF n=1 Tax=Paucibacter hankyongi TaxID=3133434 RepID=UPI0030B6BFB1
MSTRSGGVSQGPYASMNVGLAVQDEPAAVAENRARIDQALGARAIFLQQVHGADVVLLQEHHARPGAPVPVADASISLTPGLGVAIQVADCLPVLFAAPGGVAGAHAGWRGLSSGVLENTVAALCKAVHCRPNQVQAWLGVCIGPQAFEVGAEVLVAFGREASPQDCAYFRYQPNADGAPRWRADLSGLARARLQEMELSYIESAAGCSFSEPSRFFSYRRDPVCGRMVAVISLV